MINTNFYLKFYLVVIFDQLRFILSILTELSKIHASFSRFSNDLERIKLNYILLLQL